VHQVVMREAGLREVYVTVPGTALQLVEGAPSTPRLAEYLARAGVTLEPGWRVEINLCAIDWVLELQTARGEIKWARHADGTPWQQPIPEMFHAD